MTVATVWSLQGVADVAAGAAAGVVDTPDVGEDEDARQLEVPTDHLNERRCGRPETGSRVLGMHTNRPCNYHRDRSQ